MTLERLCDRMELAPEVAGWVYREFPYAFAGETFEGWLKLLDQGQRDGSITTLVGLENGRPVATASLDLADLPPRDHLSPWLASVYTLPEFRGRGLAGRLISKVEEEATERGFGRIHLHTTDQAGFYARRGWRVLERLEHWGLENVVMVKDF